MTINSRCDKTEAILEALGRKVDHIAQETKELEQLITAYALAKGMTIDQIMEFEKEYERSKKNGNQ